MPFKRRKETPTEETSEQPVLLSRIAEYTKPIGDKWLYAVEEPSSETPQSRESKSRRSRKRAAPRGHKPAPHPA